MERSSPVALRLRGLRDSAGFTQEQLADKLDMGVRTLQNYERGVTEPRPSELPKMAGVFGVDATVFFASQELFVEISGLMDTQGQEVRTLPLRAITGEP